MALVLSCAPVAAAAQGGAAGRVSPGQLPTRDNAQPVKPGTATLRGRVLAGDTGQPLRRAQVRIMSIGPAVPGQPLENRVATTDNNGRYELKEVRAGRYYLTVTKPGGYMNAQYGQQRPIDPGKPLEVLDGQTLDKIDFSLPRGGVITGRILDEVGEPVTDVQVAAMRSQSVGGVRRLVATGRTVTTNDVGEFRLFALPAGDYFLSATLRSNNLFAENENRTGYAPTYYPGTADLASAQRLTVTLGQTITDLTLPLIATRMARVTGVAVDSQSQPMRGNVTAVARSEVLGVSTSGAGSIGPDGAFAINSLAPGDYTLQVEGPGARGGGNEPEYASAEITVAGADLTGVRLMAVRPSTIAGRIVLSSGDTTALRTSTLRIMAPPMPTGGISLGPTPPPGPVNDDWTFQTKARPSQARILVQGLTPPWTVRAVRYRGTDVTDSGLDVRPGENLDDVQVELTDKVTDVSGLAINGRGEPVKDYLVVLFARDTAKRRPPTRFVRATRADQDGRFKTTGLPPGEYFAVALDPVDPSEATDPEFLDRLESRGTRFALREGETRTIDLKLSTP